MNSIENKQKIAELIGLARSRSIGSKGKPLSQQEAAIAIGKTLTTYKGYEKGTATPDFDILIRLFVAFGIQPEPYLKALLNDQIYQDLFRQRDPDSETESEENERLDYQISYAVKRLSLPEKRILNFMLNGNHGSSIYCFFQKIAADLQSSLHHRVASAHIVSNAYKMTKQMNMLTDPDGPQPDIDELDNATELGFQAAVSGKNGYVSQ